MFGIQLISRARLRLIHDSPYVELGVDYFDQLDATRIERHHIRRPEQLGDNVTLSPLAV